MYVNNCIGQQFIQMRGVRLWVMRVENTRKEIAVEELSTKMEKEKDINM